MQTPGRERPKQELWLIAKMRGGFLLSSLLLFAVAERAKAAP